MPVDRRQKNGNWYVLNERGEKYPGDYAHAHLAVLMDIRDELQALNRVFACPNFLAVPVVLREIAGATRDTRRKLTTISAKLRPRRKVKR